MHAILLSVGTDGDVIPFLALGAKLRGRGHRVTLLANEPYRALAQDRGLAFHPLVSAAETQELLTHPDFWHPLKGAPVVSRWGVRFLGRQYALLAELANDGPAVLVASPGVLVARLVQETRVVPLASVLLQPGMIPSVLAPPVMPGGLTLPRWAPRLVGKLYWRLLDVVGDVLVGRRLNRLRARLRLKRVDRVFQWWLSPELAIGLFPDWYGPPQADWPPQLRLAGFPLDDGRPQSDLAPDVLEFCRAGLPPIAFTFGTGMMHGTALFGAALEACRTLGARGLLLTKYGRQLPAPLPPSVRPCAFAPFQALFPHCAAVVHHGGVGTTAKALAAGTPQLVLPLAYDQPDNAARVKRLGVGDWLKPGRREGRHIAQALAPLLTPQARERCRTVAGRFGTEDNLSVAARWVEELGQPTPATHQE
jgi:UDP:flavonoid glycosyltransferase YjiC (YdhE family)